MVQALNAKEVDEIAAIAHKLLPLFTLIFLVAVWLGNRPDNPVSASALMGCGILGMVLFLLSWQRAWFFCFGKLWKTAKGP